MTIYLLHIRFVWILGKRITYSLKLVEKFMSEIIDSLVYCLLLQGLLGGDRDNVYF